MRLSLIISVLFVSFLLCGCAHDKEAANIFGNMTYFVNNPLFGPQTRKVTLVNQKYEERFLNVYYDNKYVYGDFNHDGLKDAAVVVFENHGGNADLYKLVFLINDGKQLVHRATRGLGVWTIVNSVREKDGKVIVDMYVHQEGDCNAGPSKRVRNVYEYTGSDDFSINTKT